MIVSIDNFVYFIVYTCVYLYITYDVYRHVDYSRFSLDIVKVDKEKNDLFSRGYDTIYLGYHDIGT